MENPFLANWHLTLSKLREAATKSQTRLLILTVAFAGLVAAPLRANQGETAPDLGVARVSLTHGDVTVRRGDSGDWTEARVNTPLVTGDTIAVGPASRAEVQLDYSNFLRLGEDTEVRLAELENHRFQIQVTHGLVTYVELRGGEADVEIDTPDVAVHPLKSGTYRIQVFENGETEVTVRSGKAEVSSREGSELLRQGRTMVVRADPTDGSVEFQIARASAKDDWDRWNEQRNRQLEQSASYRQVSHDIYGVEVLDAHGRWVYIPRYGYSWSPYVKAGWAPYRHGRWIWLDYYGWTWVSYDPWGWAPYHYGRWYHHAHHGWVWYPGNRYARHYWRPALVAFFGYSSHHGFSFGVNFGFGHIGWVPLGPGDPYYPWYGRHRHRLHSNRHNTHININIYNVYQNARVRGGVTVLDARDFSRGRGRNVRSLRSAELRRARLIQGQVPVVPTRESLGRVSRRSKQRVLARNGARHDQFYSKRRPKQVRRAPFEQQQKEIAAMVRGLKASSSRTGASGSAAGSADGTRRPPAVSSRSRVSRASGARAAAPRRDLERRGRRGVDGEATGDSLAERRSNESPSVNNARGWQRFRSSFGRARSEGGKNSFKMRSRAVSETPSNSRRNSRSGWQKLESRDGGAVPSRPLPRVNSRSGRSQVRPKEQRRTSQQSFSRRIARALPQPPSASRSAGRSRHLGSRRNTEMRRQQPRSAPSRVQPGKNREAKRSITRNSSRGSRGKSLSGRKNAGRSASRRRGGRH